MTTISNREVPNYIGSEFTNHGATLRGVRNPGWTDSGHLPHDWRNFLGGRTIAYVVYSYATPIAVELDDGRRFIPNVKYSSTTTRHQNLVRRGWSNFAEAIPA